MTPTAMNIKMSPVQVVLGVIFLGTMISTQGIIMYKLNAHDEVHSNLPPQWLIDRIDRECK